MTEYYRQNLISGNEYEDFVSYMLLKKYCMLVGVFGSKKYQNEIGESMSGIEIKFDNKLAETGNVYIELAEKSNAANKFWIPSGINRKDNTYLYLVGNYEEAFLFSKYQLRKLHDDKAFCEKHGIKDRMAGTGTSIGFTIPVDQAMKWHVIKHFYFK